MSGKTWQKSLSNPAGTPWFDWVRCGRKTYEGRLCRDDWLEIKVGDIIYFYRDGIVRPNNGLYIPIDDGEKIKVEVTEILKFKTFGEAFIVLGKNLVPEINGAEPTVADVEKIYANIYKEDIGTCEVVVVGIKILHWW